MAMGKVTYAILFENVNVVLNGEFNHHDEGGILVLTTSRPSPSMYALKIGTPPFDLARRRWFEYEKCPNERSLSSH